MPRTMLGFPVMAASQSRVFDKNGKPLTPPEGITFDGKLGIMQGIIVTPGGDVWAVGISESQILHFPKGDPTKGRSSTARVDRWKT